MNEQKRKIILGMPFVAEEGNKIRLNCPIDLNGKCDTVWYEVDSGYGDYLCHERGNALLLGVLSYAMRNNCDIVSEAPIDEQLLYQIRTYLIPAVVGGSRNLTAPEISAPMASELLPNAGAVGTGISCGVDSLHAVMNYANPAYSKMKLTHLILNNVGAFWRGKEDRQYDWQSAHAKRFCEANGFKLILSDSNLADVVPQDHLLTNTYSSCFCIYALQKLWNVYYYASVGHDFSHFTLKNNDQYDSAYYDLLTLDCFSIRTLKIYSEGGAVTRFEKMKKLIAYPPSYDFLHVCTSDVGDNCGHCGKCLRTLTMLDALKSLDLYSKSFNLNDYYNNRKSALIWLCRQHIDGNGDKMTEPSYEMLRHDITTRVRLAAFWSLAKDRDFFLKNIKAFLIRRFPKGYRCYKRIFRKS